MSSGGAHRREARPSSCSRFHCAWLSLPGCGVLTIRLMATWPMVLGDRLMDTACGRGRGGGRVGSGQ